ncbi:helix-turn-helix domain-containing protein [Chryseobacterium camelliae]|uniref:Helix-turn-helix domain-containing protein n=1 Tax=Chryseobacterium camelliae TaxID=1265445 RepID=A0ABY7QLT3_9FLAO|nr:helix-turn-helix domain-containing protein [Chryseobacterium camelliae]WBV60630.1 helix-turn-helix domain-containing protein [Chryseobacterium camelliae]
MNTLTKNDLEAFRKQMISDIGNLLENKLAYGKESEEFGWMRSKAIRKALNISASTLQNLRITGKIRFKKVLGSYYYNKEDLQHLFDDED